MSYRFQIDDTDSVLVTHDSGAKDCLPSWTWLAGAVRQLIYERETLRVRVAELELADRAMRNASQLDADEIDRLRAANSDLQSWFDAARQAVADDRAEIARLRAALVRSNTQAEQFERKWYLRGDVIEDCIPALESGLDAAQVISIFSDERPALIRDALAKARAALSQESGL